jgi:hypothetical protein
LTTGNYGLTYSDLRMWEYPYLPHFELLKIHPLSVDIGMPWTAHFFREKEGWDQPANIENSIDQFLAATIAFGRMAWLVEEVHGIRQTCRSYYMMQQLQSRYVMEKPEVVLYGSDTGMISSSEAFLTGAWKDSKLYVRYPGDLQVWVNGNPEKQWVVEVQDVPHVLPPFGWVAVQGDDFFEASTLLDGTRCDRITSPEYVFLDGRGVFRDFSGVGSAGSVAVRKHADSGLELIAVDGVDQIRLSDPGSGYAANDVRTRIGEIATGKGLTVEAIKADGTSLGRAETTKKANGWKITPVADALRYLVNT